MLTRRPLVIICSSPAYLRVFYLLSSTYGSIYFQRFCFQFLLFIRVLSVLLFFFVHNFLIFLPFYFFFTISALLKKNFFFSSTLHTSPHDYHRSPSCVGFVGSKGNRVQRRRTTLAQLRAAVAETAGYRRLGVFVAAPLGVHDNTPLHLPTLILPFNPHSFLRSNKALRLLYTSSMASQHATLRDILCHLSRTHRDFRDP